jgi:hypothetical protein
MLVVMEDIQEEDTVLKVTLPVQEAEDSSVFSLLILLKEVKSFFVLVPVVAVDTKPEEPVEEKPVVTEWVVTDNLVEPLKLMAVLEDKVYLVLASKVVTVTKEENKTL